MWPFSVSPTTLRERFVPMRAGTPVVWHRGHRTGAHIERVGYLMEGVDAPAALARVYVSPSQVIIAEAWRLRAAFEMDAKRRRLRGRARAVNAASMHDLNSRLMVGR